MFLVVTVKRLVKMSLKNTVKVGFETKLATKIVVLVNYGRDLNKGKHSS